MKQKKTILVVDDEIKIVEVVQSYLENAGYDVVSAVNGIQALKYFETRTPALVILDLMLPDMSGEDVCRAIRRISGTPVIMLTAKIAEESVIGGFSLGADDYITKPFSPRQLLARVDAILRRTSGDAVPLADELSFNGGDLVIDALRVEVRKQGIAVPLTPSEYRIFITMSKYPTRVFTRDELITYALGDKFTGFDRVVDSHIKNIRRKIESDVRVPKYIVTVRGIGYKFDGSKG